VIGDEAYKLTAGWLPDLTIGKTNLQGERPKRDAWMWTNLVESDMEEAEVCADRRQVVAVEYPTMRLDITKYRIRHVL